VKGQDTQENRSKRLKPAWKEYRVSTEASESMLKKVISIKNVGRFRNSAAAGNPQLAKYTFILGANGSGKTTICSILRSLHTGDVALVIGRKTLGIAGEPTVELLFEGGAISFNGTQWTATVPNIAIFDGAFVIENVYSGEAVDIDQKRGLYRVILGLEGVALADEEARLAAESRGRTGELGTAEKVIKPYLPTGMSVEQFLALAEDQNIDTKITDQDRTVEAVRQASEIRIRSGLSEIALPAFPETFAAQLSRTLENISDDAEKQIAEHLAAHRMTETGGAWIAEGIEHADNDTCPFCGQDTSGVALITAYRALFGDAYKALKANIETLQKTVTQQFGEGAIGRLTTLVAQNASAAEFWKRYCTFDPFRLIPPESLENAMRVLGQEAQRLLTRKSSSPLEPVPLDEPFTAAKDAYARSQETIAAVNTAIREVTALIVARRAETGAADLNAVQSELARLQAVKKRHAPAIAQVCADHIRLTVEKNNIETTKGTIRTELEAHTKKVVKPYERRINEYLESFNADFRITETKHAYPGGVATSSYQLVINNTAINLGDAKTPHDRPSFKNTLSAGDRTTLALAFFLTHLERDAGKAQKIVVLDDPFTSQDAFRRRQTVHEIRKVGRDCAQVILLSHDVTFLKQVWEKAPASERIALLINDARSLGAKLLPMDIDRACQGRVASEIDDLLTYVTTGAGKPLDLIKKMRIVLETYCRTTFPAYFEPNDWLGDIVRKIREAGDDHPAKALYDELDKVNDYSATYHHGEDVADATPEQIDTKELTGFIRGTLKIANALQA
jgi:wobble nucleotide-excising tRNase